MADMRQSVWQEHGISRTLEAIDKNIYINHTGLKIYKGAGKFDYERERDSLFTSKGQTPEYMYTFDEFNNFVPGELTYDIFARTLKK